MTIRLCINCLRDGAEPFEIGAERGTQRDPYRDTIDLCPKCKAALMKGDFGTISSEYKESRVVKKGEQSESDASG